MNYSWSLFEQSYKLVSVTALASLFLLIIVAPIGQGQGYSWATGSDASMTLPPISMVPVHHAGPARSRFVDVSYFACSLRHSHLSCILGCLRCVETYSRRVYKMAGCCRECHMTQAVLVDSGPDQCSVRFVDFDYLKSLTED